MKKTFGCDDSTIITIPIGSVRGDLIIPEKFICVFRDNYKVLVRRGYPKPLGAAQAMAGVFAIIVTLMLHEKVYLRPAYMSAIAPFVLFGMLTYAAGQFPNLHVAKLSFSLNIISFILSGTAVFFCGIMYTFVEDGSQDHRLDRGIWIVIMTLMVVELAISSYLIYWLSKAICRTHFNTLPIIHLKRGD